MSDKVVTPSTVSVFEAKSRILQPSLTSHYLVQINPPKAVGDFVSQRASIDPTTINLSCSEASLPGSSLATHEINNDYTGVTERHAYRRLYDDRVDFTFYVDRDYLQIRLFEVWMRFIAGEQLSFGEKTDVSFRSPYPKQYKASAIYIKKFERDFGIKKGSNRVLTYTFVNAFPISVTSMPVSYDSSQLLKCTVSFTYDRYFVDNPRDRPLQGEPSAPSPATGIPNPSEVSYAGGQVATDAFTGNASLNDSSLFNNIAPSQYGISAGTLSNTVGEGEELANAVARPVEEGLPYVGRNVGPLAP